MSHRPSRLSLISHFSRSYRLTKLRGEKWKDYKANGVAGISTTLTNLNNSTTFLEYWRIFEIRRRRRICVNQSRLGVCSRVLGNRNGRMEWNAEMTDVGPANPNSLSHRVKVSSLRLNTSPSHRPSRGQWRPLLKSNTMFAMRSYPSSNFLLRC